MITSPQNEKLKLVRTLRPRRRREREGLFVTEGEDLLEAGLAAGARPAAVLVREGSGLHGDEVAAELLDEVSELGSGTRAVAIWPIPAEQPVEPPCAYLHGIADPGNVGAIVRTQAALSGGTVVIGPDTADPYGPKATRASMGALFAQGIVHAGIDEVPAPRLALVAHGGEDLEAVAGAGIATICLGSERSGLPKEIAAKCELAATIPVREEAAESLNVAAAAAIAIHRIWSPASVVERQHA